MSGFEVTFLGTGTSQGVPLIGCDCAVCHSKDPRDVRWRTALYVRTPEACIVVDTPPEFRLQCLREKIDRVDAVIYTHSHVDHVLGFDDLRRFCEMRDAVMPIHVNAETMGDLQRIFQYAFDTAQQFKTYVRPEPRIFHGPFAIGDTQVTPVRLPHGRMFQNGLIFERENRKLLAYFTDCHAVPDDVIRAAHGVELLVIDALRWRGHSTHLSIPQALEIAEKIAPCRTLFTHMCHEVSHAETEARMPEHVRLAYDGLSISL